MAGPALVLPVLVAIGVVIAAVSGSKKKKKTTTPPPTATGTESPPMSAIEGVDAQMAALYARLMDPTKTNLVELEQGAAVLKGNDRNEWAGNVYSKISSLRAQEANDAQAAGAAQAAAAAAAAAAKAAGEAKAEAAKKEWEQAAGGRPSDEQLTATYLAALAPDMTDIGQMQYAIAVLQAYGRSNEAAQIQAKIVKLQAEGTADLGTAVATTKPGGQPVVLDEGAGTTPATIEASDEDDGGADEEETPVAVATTPSPLAAEETKAEADPIGTIKLARNLIAAETSSNWKTALQSDISSWQGRAGLTADGLFGPKSGLRMGEEVGILPRVRYWSKTGGTKDQQLAKYRSDLNDLADQLEAKDPKMAAHSAALRISAVNEDARGYPARPAKDTDAVTRANQAAEAAAGTEGNSEELAKLKELLKLGPTGLAEYYQRQQAAKETLGVGA